MLSHGRSERSLNQLAFERLMNRLKQQHKGTKATFATQHDFSKSAAIENESKEQEIASYYLLLLQPYF